jgi:Protein of unknown function (DUF2637)
MSVAAAIDRVDPVRILTGKDFSSMSDLSGAHRFRDTKYNNRLQLIAVVSVITGAALLAVNAFLLSYARIREIAVPAGFSPALAGLYLLIFDTTLVVVCVAALAVNPDTARRVSATCHRGAAPDGSR